MKKDIKFYSKLFWSTFSLSAFTFGGGYVIVPLMRKRFVEKLKWIENEEMINLIAIAQSSPGAIAINASVIIGYRLAGIFGALITVFGTVLPPLIIISIISLFYTAFRNNTIVNNLMLGMQAGVAAVIVDVVITMCGDIVKQKNLLFLLVMIGAFVSSFFYNVNVVFIILICGAIGAAYMYYKEKIGKEMLPK